MSNFKTPKNEVKTQNPKGKKEILAPIPENPKTINDHIAELFAPLKSFLPIHSYYSFHSLLPFPKIFLLILSYSSLSSFSFSSLHSSLVLLRSSPSSPPLFPPYS